MLVKVKNFWVAPKHWNKLMVSLMGKAVEVEKIVKGDYMYRTLNGNHNLGEGWYFKKGDVVVVKSKKKVAPSLQALKKAHSVFVKAMWEKLMAHEHIGWKGWQSKEYINDFIKRIRYRAVDLVAGKLTQEVDIANYCMFLYYHSKKEE